MSTGALSERREVEPSWERGGNLPWRFLALLAFPFCIAFGGLLLFQIVSPDTDHAAAPSVSVAPSLHFLGAFYQWLGLSLLGVFIYSGVIFFCAAQLYRSVDRAAGCRLGACCLLALVVLAAMTAFGFDLSFMRQGLNSAHSADGPIAEQIKAVNPLGESAYGFFLNAVNLLVMIAAVLVALGSVSTLSARPAGSSIDPVIWQARKLAQLNRFLYAGAAVFIAGELAITAWLALGDTLVPVKTLHPVLTDRSEYRDLATGISLYFGTLYVLILATTYSPVLAILTLRSNALAQEKCGLSRPREVRDWKLDNDLELPWFETAKTLLATVSPLIAGPVSSTIVGLATS